MKKLILVLFLAFFAVALLHEIVKAIMRPMLENLLRAACVPVAFILTFIIQIIGGFQFLYMKGIELLGFLDILASFNDTGSFLVASVATMLTPLMFLVTFLVILFILKHVHVTLLMKYINARSKRLAKRDFKNRVRMERADAIRRAERSEERIAELREEGIEVDPQSAVYTLPDEDEIEEMVEDRVEHEKRTRSRLGFFRESSEQKAISVVAGAVSGFLIFAIVMMPMFYGMTMLSTVTDGIKNTDTEESIVYQLVDVTDKHIVEPYKNSFVIQLYDSVALLDLMNYTVRAGGRMQLQSGEVVYADDTIKNLTKHMVAASVEMTAPTPNTEKLAENLNVITSDPMVVSMLTDAVLLLMKNVEVPEAVDGDIMGGLVAQLITHYKYADKELISGDLAAITDVVVVLTEKDIFTTLASGEEFDINSLLERKEDFADILAAMSGLSVFDPVVSGTFEMGIQMMGTMLGAPADNETAYDAFLQHLLESVNDKNGADFDVAAVEAFVKGCAESGTNKVVDYALVDPDGFNAFLEYMMHWSNVQKAFMGASEDKSLAYFTMNVEGQLYIFNMGDISKISELADMKKATITLVSDPMADEYKNKFSPVADLVHYLTVNSSVGTDESTLKANLAAYAELSTNEVCREIAIRLLDREAFVSAGVTVEKLVGALDFEDWTDEEKEKDVKICVDILFNFLDIIKHLGGVSTVEGESTGKTDSMAALIDQFVVLGTTMDLMMETSCMNELPPLMMDALVKHDTLSKIMTPSVVNQINDKVQNDPDITYAKYMESLAGVFKLALKALEK